MVVSMDDAVFEPSSSGGVKGVKLADFSAIPTGVLTQLAEHYGKGNAKYPRTPTEDHPLGLDNWRRGYEWSKSYSALQRHLTAFWGGQDLDPETGSKHLIAVAWHAFAMAHWMDSEEGRAFDDRQLR